MKPRLCHTNSLKSRELRRQYNDDDEGDFKVLCGEPKDVGYDVAVFEFCIQHGYSSGDGSDAIQSGSWSGMTVPH